MPTMMTIEEKKKKKSGGVLAVMFLLTVTWTVESGSPDCSPPAADSNGGVRFLSAVVDSQKAKLSQRQHLEALFNR